MKRVGGTPFHCPRLTRRRPYKTNERCGACSSESIERRDNPEVASVAPRQVRRVTRDRMPAAATGESGATLIRTAHTHTTLPLMTAAH